MPKTTDSLVNTFGRRQMLGFLKYESSLCELFHENTKLTRANVVPYVSHINAVLKHPGLVEMMRHADKVYSLTEAAIALPPLTPQNALESTIVRRRSRRRYSGEPITLAELSRLLYFAYGRTAQPPAPSHFRPVASGGALYPLELYVIALRVSDVDEAICHYNTRTHTLEVIRRGECAERVRQLLLQEGVEVEHAAAVIAVSSVLHRNLVKYQDRGYRMILIEAGEVAQNMSLIATSLELGCVWLGGFYDDELCRMLEVDEVNEPIMLAGVVGRCAGEP